VLEQGLVCANAGPVAAAKTRRQVERRNIISP
jgi:hypothetical protein